MGFLDNIVEDDLGRVLLCFVLFLAKDEEEEDASDTVLDPDFEEEGDALDDPDFDEEGDIVKDPDLEEEDFVEDEEEQDDVR